MNSFEQLLEALKYSFEAMTWITWLVLAILIGRALISFSNAYKDNTSYADMVKNSDKSGISNFYTGVIISIICVFVFFIPYFFR